MSLYPNIKKACMEISYDNGGVNRHRPETQVRKETADFLAARPYSDQFFAIDTWLGSLGRDEMQTICAGEETEQRAILASAPPFTAQLLDEYFDEVC